ncbi:hypothetical protein BC835DRAFT_746443 [Cytidiella melzeri]|nr:hypothetical protein BC835DRAFT_746443 [Cytidiella melzeri]
MFAPPLLVSVGAFSLRPDWLASLRSTISQLVRGLYIFERSFRGNAFSHGIKPQASSRGHSLTANSTHTILPIRNLLAYRLPTNCSEREARDEWRDSVEGRSALWSGIPGGRKETIRGHVFWCILRVNFSSVRTRSVLPVTVANYTVTIATELEAGSCLVGRCEILHPIRRSLGVSISFDGDDDDDGSLWSSIVPCLALRGVANTIARSLRAKILLRPSTSSLSRRPSLIHTCSTIVNSQNDRETDGYSAAEYIIYAPLKCTAALIFPYASLQDDCADTQRTDTCKQIGWLACKDVVERR